MRRGRLAAAWLVCAALAACPSSVEQVAHDTSASSSGSGLGSVSSSSQGGAAGGTTGANGGGPIASSNAGGSAGSAGQGGANAGGAPPVDGGGSGGNGGGPSGTGGNGGIGGGNGGSGGSGGGMIADAGPGDAEPDAEPDTEAGVDAGQPWPACEDLGIVQGGFAWEPCTCSGSAQADVEAIAQAAALAYQTNGAACLAAVPVAAIASGLGYMPDSAPGVDFNTGDGASGWLCLEFSLDTPVCWQLRYAQGGGYVSPALGNVDPGPEGFEAAAILDADMDAEYGVIAIVGVIDPVTQQVTLQPVFVHQPLE